MVGVFVNAVCVCCRKGGFLLRFGNLLLYIRKNIVYQGYGVLKEKQFFGNGVGSATLYEESTGGFTIEYRIRRTPGSYHCKTFYRSDLSNAMKKFNQVTGILRALQTRNMKKKIKG